MPSYKNHGVLTEAMDSINDKRDIEEANKTLDTNDLDKSIEPERPMTSRTATKLGYLTQDVIMDRLGVYDLINTKELILRDEGLIGLDDSCADKLMSLEILSLSHNKLTTLTGFQHFVNLIELNLNFNQITSLEFLECPALEKLFVSNNKIGDLTPLKAMTNLNTLSAYGNLITDLDACLHTCRSMTKLRSLDLGGNPCSREIDGYKFQVIRALPRVRTLDGEHVTQLDKDLADEFIVNGGCASTSTQSFSRPVTSSGKDFRPLTSQTGRDPLIQPWDAPDMPSKQFDAFTSKHMPKGNVRLFRDDFLNNNPILLEYLAQETQASMPSTELDNENEVANPSAFVDKMRKANPLSDHSSLPDKNDDNGTTSRPIAARPSTAISIPNVLTTHLGIDPSDPKTTIRKLLKHIEVLEESLASYTTRRVEAAENALVEENRRLQMENNNIPILQNQIITLKKQIVALKTPPCPAPSAPAKMSGVERVSELELINEQLRNENTRLKKLLKGGNGDISMTEPVSKHGSDGSLSATIRVDQEDELDVKIQTMRLTQNAELLEDSALIDVELTELILQNEVALELIRNDIKSTKKEWEVQFKEAKDQELKRQRMRPQTSLGVSDTLARLQASKDESIKSGSPATNERRQKSRQLHTSAGFHHNGPEEWLLDSAIQAPHRSSNPALYHSETNILTL